MKKVTRRWFMNAVGASGVGLAAFLPLLKGARIEKDAHPISDEEVLAILNEEPAPAKLHIEHSARRTGRTRRHPLNIGPITVPPRANAMISIPCPMRFEMHRLVTPTKGLLIDGLTVAGASQFVAAGMVPTEVFNPRSATVALSGDVCPPGRLIELSLYNPTKKPIRFHGAILGNVGEA